MHNCDVVSLSQSLTDIDYVIISFILFIYLAPSKLQNNAEQNLFIKLIFITV